MKLLENKKKYIIIGAFFFVAIIAIINFLTSKSYALEGFGELNLTCDKTIGFYGDNINCTITGTVSSTSEVTSLSSQISLSDNLELVSFTVDPIWEGDGDEGNIQLYTDVNKSSTFAIGNFSISVKDGVVNTLEEISLVNNYFYDKNFESHTIEDVSFDIKTPQYSSNVYDLSKKYIFTNTKNIADIIENIKTEGCTTSVLLNTIKLTKGNINNGAKLIITVSETTIKEYDIVYIGSEKYDLSKKYIINEEQNVNNVLNNIELINGTFNINETDNTLALIYNKNIIKTFSLVTIYSTNYKINLDENYIIIDEEITEDIFQKISTSNNIDLNINEETLELIFNNETIKSLRIINIYSDTYEINLEKGYINVFEDFANEDLKTNITSNIDIEVYDNILKFIDGKDVVSTLDIIGIYSEKYNIINNNYIYTKSDNDENIIKNNITTFNSTLDVSDGILRLLYKDGYIAHEFEIAYFSIYTYKNENKIIYIGKDIEYQEFINNISLQGVTYKIYDVNDNEINSGIINDNYTIKIYNSTQLLDAYNINVEYLKLNDYSINSEEKVIYNVPLETTYNDFINNIDTNGEIAILDKRGIEVDLNDKIKSYDILKIKLISEELEYKISILGDLTGTGTITAGDIAKAYQILKGKYQVDLVSLLAGDVTFDKQILVNDVAKLYSYLKGRLDSLK